MEEVIEETIFNFTDVQIIKERIFLPITISIEYDFFKAECPAFDYVIGRGKTEKAAIENLKKDIESHIGSRLETQRRMRIEKLFQNVNKNYHLY